MEEYTEIRYHIEVEHKAESFDSDMDFLTPSVGAAYERLQFLKEKYPGHRIRITEITETKTYRLSSESALEKLARLG